MRNETLLVRRGLIADIPSGGTLQGELRYATDSKELYIDDGTDNLLLNMGAISANGKSLVASDYEGMRTQLNIADGANTVSPTTNSADYVPQWNGTPNSKTLVDGFPISANAKSFVASDYAGMRSQLNVADGSQANANGGTLTAALNLGENAGLQLDTVLSEDEKWSGITQPGTLGATIAVGDLCYLAPADSRWELADADAQATAWGVLGLCLTAGNDGDATTMLLWGKMRSAAFPAFTVNGAVFVSTTAGDITHTAPSGASDVVRVVGFALTAEDLFFCPSNDILEV